MAKCITIVLLLLLSAGINAQQNNLLNAYRYFNNNLQNQGFTLQYQSGNDTIKHNYTPEINRLPLSGGDIVEYGMGKIPVVKPGAGNNYITMPNAYVKDEKNTLFTHIPNAAPPQPYSVPRMKIIPGSK